MIHVAMIGPVPAHWGGLKRHGGVATHVQGLVPLLPGLGVEVRLLADNTDVARPVPLPDLPVGVRVQRMARSPRALVGLGLGRLARIARKMLADPSLRQAAPLSYQLKFLGQAANFDEFLAWQTPHLLHVHHAECPRHEHEHSRLWLGLEHLRVTSDRGLGGAESGATP